MVIRLILGSAKFVTVPTTVGAAHLTNVMESFKDTSCVVV
jgi:hypothetical protein